MKREFCNLLIMLFSLKIMEAIGDLDNLDMTES